MAYEIPNFKLGIFPANIDFSNESTFQFTGVAIGAASGSVTGTGVGGAALVEPSAGGQIVGVLQNAPLPGEAGDLIQSGVTKALCGGTFAIGANLAVTTAGKFVAAVTGNQIVAIALETGVSGAIASVLLASKGISA